MTKTQHTASGGTLRRASTWTARRARATRISSAGWKMNAATRRVKRTWINGCDKAGALGGRGSLHGAVWVCIKTAVEFVKLGAPECRWLDLLGAL